MPFFGNILTDNGIKPDPTKVEAIKNWPIPKTVKDLQSFLGAVNFLGKFIQGLSSLRSSLQGLIKERCRIHMDWNTHQCIQHHQRGHMPGNPSSIL